MHILPAQGCGGHVSSLTGECGTAPPLAGNYEHQIYSCDGKKVLLKQLVEFDKQCIPQKSHAEFYVVKSLTKL